MDTSSLLHLNINSKFLISYHQNNENRIERVEKFVKHLPSIPLVNTKTTHETILLQNKAEYFQLKDCDIYQDILDS